MYTFLWRSMNIKLIRETFISIQMIRIKRSQIGFFEIITRNSVENWYFDFASISVLLFNLGQPMKLFTCKYKILFHLPIFSWFGYILNGCESFVFFDFTNVKSSNACYLRNVRPTKTKSLLLLLSMPVKLATSLNIYCLNVWAVSGRELNSVYKALLWTNKRNDRFQFTKPLHIIMYLYLVTRWKLH